MTAYRISFLLMLIVKVAAAQNITQIKVGVNGLTCSACTRSVEMSLLRLDFVDSVQMCLENTEGLIFTGKSTMDFNQIAKAVTNAGFSVRFLQAKFSFTNTGMDDNGCFKIDGNNFQWIGFQKSNTPLTLTFIDSSFLPGNQYSKWKKKLVAANCFAGQPTYHVTYLAN